MNYVRRHFYKRRVEHVINITSKRHHVVGLLSPTFNDHWLMDISRFLTFAPKLIFLQSDRQEYMLPLFDRPINHLLKFFHNYFDSAFRYMTMLICIYHLIFYWTLHEIILLLSIAFLKTIRTRRINEVMYVEELLKKTEQFKEWVFTF